MRGCPATRCVYHPECSEGLENDVNCGNGDAACHPDNPDLYAVVMRLRHPEIRAFQFRHSRWFDFHME